MKNLPTGEYSVEFSSHYDKDQPFDFGVMTYAQKQKAAITGPNHKKPEPENLKDSGDGVEVNGYRLNHKVESTANGQKVTASLTRTTGAKAVVEFWIWVGSLNTGTI